MGACVFCQIAEGEVTASIVFQDNDTLAFLDHRPLFPGHCLLIPKRHIETLIDVQPTILSQLASNARLLAMAMENGLGAQGAFIALNNRVSQSVAHVHMHVVPRTRGDGLKGFFWPRQKYRSPEHMEQTREKLARSMEELNRAQL